MRISDWMSDVCSSDLLNFCRLDTHSVAAGKSLEMQPHGRRERRIDDRKTQSASGSLRPRGPGERLQHRLAHAVRQAGARVLHTKTRTIRIHHHLAACRAIRSEEHTSELQSLMRISYAVFCLKKKKQITTRYNEQRKKQTRKTT